MVVLARTKFRDRGFLFTDVPALPCVATIGSRSCRLLSERVGTSRAIDLATGHELFADIFAHCASAEHWSYRTVAYRMCTSYDTPNHSLAHMMATSIAEPWVEPPSANRRRAGGTSTAGDEFLAMVLGTGTSSSTAGLADEESDRSSSRSGDDGDDAHPVGDDGMMLDGVDDVLAEDVIIEALEAESEFGEAPAEDDYDDDMLAWDLDDPALSPDTGGASSSSSSAPTPAVPAAPTEDQLVGSMHTSIKGVVTCGSLDGKVVGKCNYFPLLETPVKQSVSCRCCDPRHRICIICKPRRLLPEVALYRWLALGQREDCESSAAHIALLGPLLERVPGLRLVGHHVVGTGPILRTPGLW